MSEKFTFVCFKWRGPPGYRSQFNCKHVNTLGKMIKRHFNRPHELVCITDNATGIDKDIRIVPLWDDYSKLVSPHGINSPSCYRRLKIFSEEAKDIIAPRFLCLDLDVVITGDLTSLVDREEDFIAFGDTHPTTYYNGSIILLKAGSRKEVWEDFHPIESPKKAKELKQYGSDQGWIGARLGPNEAKFTTDDGVYSWRCHLANKGGRLPQNAKVVLFHGCIDPDHRLAQIQQWVRLNYA